MEMYYDDFKLKNGAPDLKALAKFEKQLSKEFALEAKIRSKEINADYSRGIKALKAKKATMSKEDYKREESALKEKKFFEKAAEALLKSEQKKDVEIRKHYLEYSYERNGMVAKRGEFIASGAKLKTSPEYAKLDAEIKAFDKAITAKLTGFTKIAREKHIALAGKFPKFSALIDARFERKSSFIQNPHDSRVEIHPEKMNVRDIELYNRDVINQNDLTRLQEARRDKTALPFDVEMIKNAMKQQILGQEVDLKQVVKLAKMTPAERAALDNPARQKTDIVKNQDKSEPTRSQKPTAKDTPIISANLNK